MIGVRRCGKTTYLWQCVAERLAADIPREALPVLGPEDGRLAGLQVTLPMVRWKTGMPVSLTRPWPMLCSIAWSTMPTVWS